MVSFMRRCILSLVMSLTIISVAQARIAVSPDIVNFGPHDLPRQDVIVFNQGDKNAYVDATPYLIKDPGTKHEKKVVIRNPAKLGLLISPSKVVIPPKQHRRLRFMLLAKNRSKEKIYRVKVAPVPNELIPVKYKNVKGRKIGLRIVIGYGVLVIARPVHMFSKLVVHRNGTRLTIKNVGNTNILVGAHKQCTQGKCFKLPEHRLYAGNVLHVKLPFARPIKLTTQCQRKVKHILSN